MGSNESLLNESMEETQSPPNDPKEDLHKWVDIVDIGGSMTVIKADHKEIDKILMSTGGRKRQNLFVISIAGEEEWTSKAFFIDSLLSYLEHKVNDSDCEWIRSTEPIERTNYATLREPGLIQMFNRPFKITRKTDRYEVWVLLVDAQNLLQPAKRQDNTWTESVHPTIASCGFVVSTLSIYITKGKVNASRWDFLGACIQGLKQYHDSADRVIKNLLFIHPDETSTGDGNVKPYSKPKQSSGNKDTIDCVIGGLRNEHFDEVTLPPYDGTEIESISPASNANEGEKKLIAMFSKVFDHVYELINSEKMSSLMTRDQLADKFKRLKRVIVPSDEEFRKGCAVAEKQLMLGKRIEQLFDRPCGMNCGFCCKMSAAEREMKDMKRENVDFFTTPAGADVERLYETRARTAKILHGVMWSTVLPIIATITLTIFFAAIKLSCIW